MALGDSSDMSSHNRTTETVQIIFSLALSSNNQIPEYLYKQFPVSYLLVGAVLNLLLIYYIVASKRYTSLLFIFIGSLAITELLSCIGYAGWAGLIYPTIVTPYPTLACKLVTFVGGSSATGSGYHLLFFSCLRYYQLCYPLRARANVTRGLVLKLCIGIWFVCIVAWVINILYFHAVVVLYDGIVLLPLCAFSGDVTIREWGYLLFCTIIPCSIILTMHVLKYVQLYCQSKRTKHIAVQQERQNADARAIAIIIILFFIAWCPVNIYGVLRTYSPAAGPYQDKLFLALVYMIAYNSTLNPIVYVIAGKSIRTDIQRFLGSGNKKS